jgi:probable selenium-dependent hydroxylase accessory protein YqeC
VRIELATSLIEALDVPDGALVSLVGAGGKTSLMYGLGREAVAAGRAALLTTTTRVLYPAAEQGVSVVLGEETEATTREIRDRLGGCGPVLAGRARLEEKIAGFSPAYVDALHHGESAWTVVVECDGAMGGSLKVPREFEPPLAESTDIYVVVVGADCLGGRLDSREVFNPEAVASVAGVEMCAPVDRDVVVRSVVSPGSYLGRKPAAARCCVFINKVGVGTAAQLCADADRARVTAAFEIGFALKSHDEIERVVYGSLEQGPDKGFLVLR